MLHYSGNRLRTCNARGAIWVSPGFDRQFYQKQIIQRRWECRNAVFPLTVLCIQTPKEAQGRDHSSWLRRLQAQSPQYGGFRSSPTFDEHWFLHKISCGPSRLKDQVSWMTSMSFAILCRIHSVFHGLVKAWLELGYCPNLGTELNNHTYISQIQSPYADLQKERVTLGRGCDFGRGSAFMYSLFLRLWPLREASIRARLDSLTWTSQVEASPFKLAWRLLRNGWGRACDASCVIAEAVAEVWLDVGLKDTPEGFYMTPSTVGTSLPSDNTGDVWAYAPCG